MILEKNGFSIRMDLDFEYLNFTISKFFIEKIILILTLKWIGKLKDYMSQHIYQLFDLLSQLLSLFGFLGDVGEGDLKFLQVLKNDNTSWKRVAISSISAFKSLGWVVVVVGVSMIIASA